MKMQTAVKYKGTVKGVETEVEPGTPGAHREIEIGYTDRPCFVVIFPDRPFNRLYVADKNGLTDWPVQYQGREFYDHPERIPHYARKLVRRGYRMLNDLTCTAQ